MLRTGAPAALGAERGQAVAEHDAKTGRAGDHGVRARLVVKMHRGGPVVPGDAGEQRRVAAVQARARERSAVAVGIDDGRQLEAKNVPAWSGGRRR